MPMIKKDAVLIASTVLSAKTETEAESGATAAIERLSKPVEKAEPKPTYRQRDFDAEARGKVKCVMFEAALQSPAIAGLRFDSLEEFLKLVEKAADAGVAYTWK